MNQRHFNRIFVVLLLASAVAFAVGFWGLVNF